jgi:ribose transport system substrate-binding protein
MSGKKILSVPVSSSIPFIENIETAMKAVAPTLGFTITEWTNRGQPTQWSQGVDRAISGKFDALDLFGGINPALMEPQVKAAKAAGLPVLSSHYADTTQPPAPGVDVTLQLPYHDVGEIIASWIILQTHGQANVLIIQSEENYPVPIYVAKMKSTFEKYCGAGCTTKVINVPIPEWASKIQPSVQAALNADPKINYIVPVFDSMIQFVMPALTITGRKGQVKIASFNGTPFVIDLIQKGEVEMDIGESLGWIARSTLDGYMRKLCGLPSYSTLNVPLYIFSAKNAKAVSPPTSTKVLAISISLASTPCGAFIDVRPTAEAGAG